MEAFRYRILLPLAYSDVVPEIKSKSRRKLIERGFEPIVVHSEMSPAQLNKAYAETDGTLFPGGLDIDPSFYGHIQHPAIGRTDPKLDNLELDILKRARNDGKPLLAFCRGAQIMALGQGGDLFPHVPDIFPEEDHGASIEVHGPSQYHDVALTAGSRAQQIFGTTLLPNMVSRHHQGVKDPGKLVVSGRSPAGLIEAMEDPTLPFHVGFQFHGDLIQATPQNTLLMNRAYTAFGDAIEVYAAPSVRDINKRAS